jgi:squalene synthase HpnD
MSASVATNSPSSSQRASGSSFYTAMRILPAAQRDAMYEIYSFCRRVDDIADSDDPRPQRLAQLRQWRDDVDALYAGRPPDHLAGLAQPLRQFGFAREDFLELIAGMEMDAAGDIRAPDLATLDLYCDRVASAVGRLSVRIFGMEPEEGKLLSHHLGRALQLTNILRDIDEDAGIGRLYLPREALSRAGISGSDPGEIMRHPDLGTACMFVAERARNHFTEAYKVLTRSSRRTVRAPRIMGEVYREILNRLVARGWAAPRQPVRIPRAFLLWTILRFALV